MSLQNVRNIVLVLSGKGGVGKSSVTTQLALTLSLQGYSVGVLDIDLTGPSVPRFFRVENVKVRQAPGGWIPVPVHNATRLRRDDGTNEIGALSCMSLGFILSSRSDAVIWRGPKKTAMVRQFLESVLWPPGLDYLLIDTPPGTSDEHISLLETLLKSTDPSQLAGAVVVTTPQAVSVSDVKKELNFCSKVGIRVLGVIENMAGFVCPNCHECTDIFSKGGGEVMAMDFKVPFLGRVPIDPAFVLLIEDGITPTYPEGTIIEGKDLGATRKSQLEALVTEEPKLLAEKYLKCSLHTIFDKMVGLLVSDIESHSNAYVQQS